MKFKKRGVGAMIFGLLLIAVFFYPALMLKNSAGITLFVIGWVLFIIGSVVRGKQKENQRQVEEAMYNWAKTQNAKVPADPPAASHTIPLSERYEALEKENAQLRSRCASPQDAAARASQAAQQTPQQTRSAAAAPWEQQAEERSVVKLAAALEEAKEIIRSQNERIEHLEAVIVEKNLAQDTALANISEQTENGAQFPKAYIVLDIETTGLFPSANEIIELGAIKYCDGEEAAVFHSFIKPAAGVPAQVTKLTGITDADLADAPAAPGVLMEALRFIGSLPLVAHNAPFDIRFLSASLQKCGLQTPENPVYDTLRMASYAFPGLPSYQLSELQNALQLGKETPHRALADVRITHALFERCAGVLAEYSPRPAREICAVGRPSQANPAFEIVDVNSIRPTVKEIDPAHPLYQKRVVFTGSFSQRVADMMQIAVNCGAIVQERVTMKTDYLVIGQQDPDIVGPDGKSAKMRKAEQYNADHKAVIVTLDEAKFLALALPCREKGSA